MNLQAAPDVLERHGAFYRPAPERQTEDHTAWTPDGAEIHTVRAAPDDPLWAAPPRTPDLACKGARSAEAER